VRSPGEIVQESRDFSLHLDHPPGRVQVGLEPGVAVAQPLVVGLDRICRWPPTARREPGQSADIAGLAPLGQV